MKTSLYISILILLSSYQPADFLDELQAKYDRYVEKFPQVKIHLQFNQPEYSPGDTAFFSAWYLNEAFQPVKGNNIITVDLVSGDGKISQAIKFKIKEGRSSNQIILRKDLTPGEFKIYAYTDWQRNFGTDWFFQKKLEIVSGKQIITKEKQKLNEVKFYAEGGNLIKGIGNKIAVTGPAKSELMIKDQLNTEITKVTLDSTGFGAFILSPAESQKYSALQIASGKSWPLPDVKPDGIAIHFDQKNPGEITLSAPQGSAYLNQKVYPLVLRKGKIILKREAVIPENQTFQFTLPPQDNGNALYQIYVFDQRGQLLSERVFIPDLNNGMDIKLQFPAVAKQRERVTGAIRITDTSGNSIKSDFSLSVIQSKLFEQELFDPYLFLIDLPAARERMEKFGSASLSNINDFLISQSWKRIDWNVVLNDKPFKINYLFQNQMEIKGQVLSKSSGQPAPDSTVVATYLQNNTIGYEGYTKKGNFEIPLMFDFWGDDHIYFTLLNKSRSLDEDYNIIISKDSLSFNDSWSSTQGNLPSAYGDYLFKRKLVASSYNFYNKNQDSKSTKDQSRNKVFEEEFLGADYSVNVSDYIVFPKMEDLIREVISFVQYRKRGNNETIRINVRLENTVRTYKGDPLYIMDGVMTRNTKFFLSIKPENLLTIKIINNPNKLFQLGRLGENGVIFVESKKGDLGKQLNEQNVFPITGLTEAVEFPVIEHFNSTRIPDLRSTLYWNPSIVTNNAGNAEISFSTSDDVGPIKVIINGFTSDGRPFSAEQLIDVGFNSEKK